MQVNPNTLLSKTLALSADEFRKIPGVFQPAMRIFAKHAPMVGPENFDIRFTVGKINYDERALVNAAAKLAKAEKLEKMHKILSITLLAVTVTLVAAAILLTVFVNPLFLALLYGVLVLTIAASILQIFCTQQHRHIPVPIGAEAAYIYKAFKHPNPKPPTPEKIQADIEEHKKKLERDLERLQVIRQHQDAIRKGILQDLAGINIADYKSAGDIQLITNARQALKTLDELMASCEKIQ